MSFYSPIDRLAQNLPRPKGTGAEFMTELSKMPGYKTQEAEDRGLQALTNLPKMERAQFLEIMRLAKPAVVPKTGALQTPHHENYTLPGGSNYREILLTHPNPKAKFQGVPHHFGGVPNILASVRAKDRKGPNGEKILHIEELQSDWHQKGRERGYIGQETPKINEEEHKRALGLQQRDIRGEELTPEERNELEEIRNRHISSIPAVRVPDAPFKKNWHEMALKKMIHHAAKNGYDSIAITPGAEQADRYGLAKHVGLIRHMTHEDNPNSGSLIAYDQQGNKVFTKDDVPHEKLPEYIGKEGAQKLMDQKPDSVGYRELSGQNLQVGGEGMKGFYDKIVPNFLNQFGKKYGAKVGQIQVPVVHALQGLRRVNGYPDDPPLNLHHFPITPEMRKDVVKNGVPLYAGGGSVEDDEPKKTVKAYKLFRVHPKHPGKLFPLFVDANTPVEMDKWIDAKEGEMAKGKVKSKIGPLAYRPGWHAGDLPIATHIGEKSDPSLTAPDVRPENHAWAEVEMPDDVDWQAEATKRGTNAQGRVIPVKAHITDQIPKGGHYRYKTNPNMTGNWLIGGSMKVNRVLTDKEVAKINKAAGLADLPRAQPFKAKKFGFAGGGTVAPDEWKAEEHVNHMAKGGPISMKDMRKALGKPDVGGTAHMAGGGRTPKMPWERHTQPKKETEMRTREINPVAGAIKSGADYASNLLDKGPSIRNVLGNVIEAVPFVGPDLRKRMEASNISIPTDVNLASNMPAKDYQYGQPMQYRKPGISTASVPTKDVLDALKMSDLTGTAGLSRAAESAGYGRTPDISDMLDTLGLAAAGYGVTKTGIKGSRAAVGALGDLAKSETGYNLAQKMLELTPGAQPSYIMMGPGSRTWNQKSFEDAVHLAGSKGNLMPPEEVWKRTGNIPNARDFVPRQEINDRNSKFYTPAELKQKLNEAKAMLHWAKQQPLLPKWSTLPDEHRNNFLVYADKLNTVVKDLSEDPEIGIKAKYVLDHPELYAAYPELGEILISQTGQSNLNLKGGFNSKNPEIRIYPQVDPRGTAIHEMQHAVQEIEGMSPGTSPSRYGEDLANYLKFHKAVTDAYPNLDPKQAAEDAMHGWYRSHMGEAEARQATERMDMSPQERLSNFPDYDVEPKWLIDKPAEAPDISLDPTLQYERPVNYAKGGRIKPVGYTKEQVTVSPNLDAMRYELMSVKRYTKKVK